MRAEAAAEEDQFNQKLRQLADQAERDALDKEFPDTLSYYSHNNPPPPPTQYVPSDPGSAYNPANLTLDESPPPPPPPREVPYNDPQQPGYNNGATQMDHEDAKIWGGTLANRPLAAETNMRRGGFDGALYRDYLWLRSQGMNKGDARSAIQSEIDALKNSPPPRSVDPDILDLLPSNPE